MIRNASLALALALTTALATTAAEAQTASATDTRTFQVTGNVPVICTGGSLAGGARRSVGGCAVRCPASTGRSELRSSEGRKCAG